MDINHSKRNCLPTVRTLVTACFLIVSGCTTSQRADAIAKSKFEEYCLEHKLDASSFVIVRKNKEGGNFGYSFEQVGPSRQIVEILIDRWGDVEQRRFIELDEVLHRNDDHISGNKP